MPLPYPFHPLSRKSQIRPEWAFFRALLGDQAAGTLRAQGRRMSARDIGLFALSPTDEAPSRDPFEALTRREQEVAELAVLGFSNREIARNLRIAEGTARIHVEHILAKLDLHSRAQLAAWAARSGVLGTQ